MAENDLPEGWIFFGIQRLDNLLVIGEGGGGHFRADDKREQRCGCQTVKGVFGIRMTEVK